MTLLFVPIAIGLAAWAWALIGGGALITAGGAWKGASWLRDRRHMTAMGKAYTEFGSIGLYNYLRESGWARDDAHAQSMVQEFEDVLTRAENKSRTNLNINPTEARS